MWFWLLMSACDLLVPFAYSRTSDYLWENDVEASSET